MIDYIVPIAAIGVLGVFLLIKRPKKIVNFNGICDKECEDCTESSWCVIRYKVK